MTNRAKEVQAQIKALREEKEAELNAIQQKTAEIKEDLVKARERMAVSVNDLDLPKYEAAAAAVKKAETAIEMYSARHQIIQKREYISEEESDKVIDSLLAYEEVLSSAFKAKMDTSLKELAKVYEDYKGSIKEAEDTILTWTGTIHANYRAAHTTYHDGTNRSPNPVPVRMSPYDGCTESKQLADYLRLAKYI